jgi:hypothetical protein
MSRGEDATPAPHESAPEQAGIRHDHGPDAFPSRSGFTPLPNPFYKATGTQLKSMQLATEPEAYFYQPYSGAKNVAGQMCWGSGR